jgi:hypothetical protein
LGWVSDVWSCECDVDVVTVVDESHFCDNVTDCTNGTDAVLGQGESSDASSTSTEWCDGFEDVGGTVES